MTDKEWFDAFVERLRTQDNFATADPYWRVLHGMKTLEFYLTRESSESRAAEETRRGKKVTSYCDSLYRNHELRTLRRLLVEGKLVYREWIMKKRGNQCIL